MSRLTRVSLVLQAPGPELLSTAVRCRLMFSHQGTICMVHCSAGLRPLSTSPPCHQALLQCTIQTGVRT